MERPFRNFLDLILFPKSSIFKKMKDVDDDDEDEDSSSDGDDYKSRNNDDVSDDGGDRDSIPKKARRG